MADYIFEYVPKALAWGLESRDLGDWAQLMKKNILKKVVAQKVFIFIP